MNWQKIPLIVAIFLAGCATQLESVYIPADSSGWKLGFSRDSRGQTIAEYVPANETINNWNMLLTIQFLEGESRTPLSVMEELRAKMQARCPGSFWNVIRQETNSVLYEWKITNCGTYPNQHEIARTLRGNDGVHRIAYAEKTDALSTTNRDKWIRALSDAYVIKDGKQVVLTP